MMPQRNVNSMINQLGDLTPAQTQELAQACLGELDVLRVIAAVTRALDETDLAELAAQIEDRPQCRWLHR